MNNPAICFGKIFRENLRTKLNDEEIRNYARDLANYTIKLNEMDSNKKSVMASFKAKIDSFNGKLNSLSRKISTGHEYRDIECQWKFDFKSGAKVLIRLDTNEIIQKDKITDQDRQTPLDMNEKNVENAKAK